MDPRRRGDDGPALNSPCQSLPADFFTRSKACLHLLLPHPQAGADGEKGRYNFLTFTRGRGLLPLPLRISLRMLSL